MCADSALEFHVESCPIHDSIKRGGIKSPWPQKTYSTVIIEPCGKLALGQNSRFARCHHLTTTTRILFVVSLLFKVMLKPQWGLNNNCPN